MGFPAPDDAERPGHPRSLRPGLAVEVDGRSRGGRARNHRTTGRRHSGSSASGCPSRAPGGRGWLRGHGRFTALWRHATDFLLARSAEPPAEPRDWFIDANIACRCEHCRKLKAFCRDADAKTVRFPLRKELRAHLHQTIDRHRLDIDHVTERRGRPYTLVCTKNRASYRRRLDEYAEDVTVMRTLIQSAPGGEQSATCAPALARLHAAVTERGRGYPSGC